MRPADAFEVLAASVALGGERSSAVLQGRYKYRDQPAVADCAELVARELINSLLWDQAGMRFEPARLPASCRPPWQSAISYLG